MFPKQPSYQRARLLAFGGICVLGRACLSRIISFLGLDQKDWSAPYKFFSRTRWQEEDLFYPILKEGISLIDEPLIAIAFDDTKLHKTGKKIKTGFWQRDPLSPPFHCNFLYGLRFLQGALLIPLYKKNDQPPRSLPIMFKEAPAVKKPGKKATAEEMQQYKKDRKTLNLSQYFLNSVKNVRDCLDKAGVREKLLVVTVDGSFCNKACMQPSIERTCIIARARKDAKLCFRAVGNTRKYYGDEKFTPEQVRQDESILWKNTSVYHGGEWRVVRYKEVNKVLWHGGTGQRFLKLLVIAPTPYRLTKKKRLYYRDPAYLFCQESCVSSEVLIQKYFDRWQIEVNHREEKDVLGVGQAQVRSKKSVARQPSFIVAAYSALLLAGIKTFEDKRSSEFIPLPKWRRKAKRPSCLDLVQMLRKEALSSKSSHTFLGLIIDVENVIFKSAA